MAQARQLVNHGHITVNNKVINIPSFQCRLNDIISVKEKSSSKNLIDANLKNNQRSEIPSNLKFGLGYAPIKNLFVGAGITKERKQVDLSAKYSLLQQTTDGKMPVSVTYFGNMVFDTRSKDNFRYGVHRLSYFNQLMIARKITKNFSAQVAPSFSWFNNVEGYIDSKGEIQKKMNNGHLAISVLGRYKVSQMSSIIVGYDQPLTEHTTNNPHPNICFGFETVTSSHAFQVFFGNYYGIVPQSNNMFNRNDYREGQYVIGFNITRLWNF